MEYKDKIFNMDCLQGLKTLPDNCIDCCVTSPPYFGLRDYGTATWEGGNKNCEHLISSDDNAGEKQKSNFGSLRTAKNICRKCGAKRIDVQIGLEETPDDFVSKLVEVFAEVKRVLKPEGTLWLNLGDSYARVGGDNSEKGRHWDNRAKNPKTGHNRYAKDISLKPKDLIGVPWMVAFALRTNGWYLRQDIIWNKPNPMPESVTDRCTKAHEYIFLMSKSQKYFYNADAIKYPVLDESIKRVQSAWNGNEERSYINGKQNNLSKYYGTQKAVETTMANKRSVWTVTTKPYSEAHFATFPEDLIVDCIKAGCPEGGIVLDPFMGAGTTALVAKKLNRNYVGFELNPEYIKIAERRIYNQIGLFL
jgi:DNA modification methylase